MASVMLAKTAAMFEKLRLTGPDAANEKGTIHNSAFVLRFGIIRSRVLCSRGQLRVTSASFGCALAGTENEIRATLPVNRKLSI